MISLDSRQRLTLWKISSIIQWLCKYLIHHLVLRSGPVRLMFIRLNFCLKHPLLPDLVKFECFFLETTMQFIPPGLMIVTCHIFNPKVAEHFPDGVLFTHSCTSSTFYSLFDIRHRQTIRQRLLYHNTRSSRTLVLHITCGYNFWVASLIRRVWVVELWISSGLCNPPSTYVVYKLGTCYLLRCI